MDFPSGGIALAVLAALGVLGLGRAIALGMRGVLVIPVDRQRRLHEILADVVFALSFLLWIHEVIAAAWPLERHLVPAALAEAAFEALPVQVAGAAVMATGLAIYGLALQAFGPSWRFTIDRERAGELVTGGIFARTRNPIYLALGLVAFGSALLLARPILFVLTLVFVAYFAHLVRREEAFLRGHYGEAYRDYCRRVDRVWTFRARRRDVAPLDP
ncbi:MAG: methyltransferase family protein [Myxococcota bacterium]